MNAPLPLARPDLLRSLARIGDRWLAADDGRSFAVRNPASGAPCRRLLQGRPDDAGRELHARLDPQGTR